MQNQPPRTTTVDRFTIGRCDDCGSLLAPEASTCSSCRGTEISRTPSEGTGSIVAWTVLEVSPSRTYTDVIPYTIAIVALDEGPWTYAWIEGAPMEGAERPRVRYSRMMSGEPYPLFVQQTC
ncbi:MULTISPECIES: Zn-ribbon domain-containing OB-fold protein [unclassified Rhodococcus (in: high G+C Gram-positive bacteria)]|uniref:Zn-ribbon domain-containing OB-fold protein n=1 Tax=unclassified Rhodococcus (in: high G+C Gram-positive bacteria) TaxID=192944 RepID=UPI0015827113|nr:OB-fold domain-containing protein [Rhodococcus sp. W8901]QKT09854.1 OB-fold domain-containing protein [Rhodococcus sp. W8901]